MKTYTKKELAEILQKHQAWLADKQGGERADLRYADLSYADLRYADLSYADLRNADLSYANLRNADLSNANLRNADLSNANLRNAGLRYADLRYADLSYADLRNADLRNADLSYADLSNADLSYADLRNADLRNADLSYADLSFNCFFGGSKGAPVFQACRGFGSRHATLTLLALGEPEEWRFFTGCFRGTRVELEKAVAEKHGGTKEQANYLRAIEYLVETAKANA